jgi:hypothetical protein
LFYDFDKGLKMIKAFVLASLVSVNSWQPAEPEMLNHHIVTVGAALHAPVRIVFAPNDGVLRDQHELTYAITMGMGARAAAWLQRGVRIPRDQGSNSAQWLSDALELAREDKEFGDALAQHDPITRR